MIAWYESLSDDEKLLLIAAAGSLAVVSVTALYMLSRPTAVTAPEPVAVFETHATTARDLAGQRVRKATAFHLRPTQIAASVGEVLPAGTSLLLVQEGRLRRGSSVMWLVRLDSGRVGWTFVGPDETGQMAQAA